MPSQQPIVYIHIGLAKTGTTYLQHLMRRNCRSLERGGLRYAGMRRGKHFEASIDLREAPFAGDERTHKPGAWDVLAADARSASQRAIISHETLSRATPEQAKRAVTSLEPAEVHLIVTLRDLARQVPALWQERLKNRSGVTYTHFLNGLAGEPKTAGAKHFWKGQDVVDVLARWGEVPPERVHVVTVPRPGAPRGLLWERFASAVDVDPGLATATPSTANASLGVVEAELLRRLNPALRAATNDWLLYERAVKHHFVHDVLAGNAADPRLVVPKGHRAWVKRRAQEMIDFLAAGDYQIVGDLAELEPQFGDEEFVSPSKVPPTQLLDVAGECLAQLVVENDKLRRKARLPIAEAQGFLERWRTRRRK